MKWIREVILFFDRMVQENVLFHNFIGYGRFDTDNKEPYSHPWSLKMTFGLHSFSPDIVNIFVLVQYLSLAYIYAYIYYFFRKKSNKKNIFPENLQIHTSMN